MYTILEIETAILDALGASEMAHVARTIEPYHGEVEALVAEVKQLIAPTPAVYVIYVGSIFDESANRSFDDEQTFSIIHIAKDLRGNAQLRAAIYPMLEITKSALIDNNLGLNIEPLHPVRIDPVAVTRAFSIYGFDVKTSFSMD